MDVSHDQLAVIAQVSPVFMLIVVAERRVFLTKMRGWWILFNVWMTLAVAVLFATVIWSVLAMNDGLHGASGTWLMYMFTIATTMIASASLAAIAVYSFVHDE